MRVTESLRLRSLAEAVIMQAMEDLWDREYRRQSLDFFSGGRFRDCADLAAMGLYEQLALLQILRNSLQLTPGVRNIHGYIRKAAPCPAPDSAR